MHVIENSGRHFPDHYAEWEDDADTTILRLSDSFLDRRSFFSPFESKLLLKFFNRLLLLIKAARVREVDLLRVLRGDEGSASAIAGACTPNRFLSEIDSVGATYDPVSI